MSEQITPIGVELIHEKHQSPISNPSTTSSGSPEACIFVANLPQQLDNIQLAEKLTKLFTPFGQILAIKTSRDKKGRPFGFIQFEDVEDAYEASVHAVGMKCEGRKLRVEKAKCIRTLLIRHIPSEYDGQELKEEFEKYGNLEVCFVAWTMLGEEMLKTACLQFKNRQEAVDAYKGIRNDHSEWELSWVPNYYAGDPAYWIAVDDAQGNRKVEKLKTQSENGILFGTLRANELMHWPIMYPQSTPIMIPRHTNADLVIPNKVFIGRLNSSMISEDLLREKFGVYGEIQAIDLVHRSSVNFPMDSHAFVTFRDHQSVHDAIQNENGTVWLGQTISCAITLQRQSVGPPQAPLVIQEIQKEQLN